MKKLLLVLSFLLLNAGLWAQNGIITGVITDGNGITVPGATVQILSVNKATVTDANGKYAILGLAEGNYELVIKYLGYQDIIVEVMVSDSQTTVQNLELKSSDFVLDDVEVSAYRLSGQARALNVQKNNVNITNVVSTDQIGKFPDANIGDAVKRIPGITMQVDQGEARNIIVRGLAPQLNSVTLNGSRIPSAEGDNRNIQMDLIPSDMIQTVEVNKAVTPDMDGDALGGSINLITRTSPEGFRLSATAGSGVNIITDKRILNGSFLLGDRAMNGKLGWLVAASVNDNDFGSDNVEAEWADSFEYNTGVNDPDGEPILEEVDVDPYNNIYENRTYLVQRIRRSFSANLDYAFDANNKVFFKSMYNWRDDRENRLALSNEILDAEDILPGDFEINGSTVLRFPAEIKRETKGGIDSNRNQNRRLEDQRMQNYTLNGEHLWGTLRFDWLVSYAKASEERLNERYLTYATEYGIERGLNTRFPIFTPVNSDDAALGNFEFDELTEENQYTEESDYNAFLNFALPVSIVSGRQGKLKFGLRARFKDKFVDNNFFEFSPLNPGFETLAQIPVNDFTDDDFLAGGQYVSGSFASPDFLGGLNLNNTGAFEAESVPDEFLRANFDVREDVYAAYAMAEQKVSDRLTILGGVRVENTRIEATGNQILDEEDLIGSVTDESSYTNVMPGIHFKYDLNDRTVFRFAWTNTLARPNYVDLVPVVDIVSDDNEIILGNPELDPTTSMNFDLMAEHYFANVGIISGGIFYKRINDFIYTSVFDAPDNSLGAGTQGFNVFQPQNGDDANILGAEVAFQRQLDFLPGFAKNFSIYLNYTYLTSSADGIRNEDGDEREDLDLPNTAPNMFNASLAYSAKKLSLRLSANYSDAYIDEIGGRAFEDRYYDEQFFLDFNLNYAINKNLRVYADVNNITNQPLRYYQGVRDRTMQMEFYERRITFGLKYDLFNK